MGTKAKELKVKGIDFDQESDLVLSEADQSEYDPDSPENAIYPQLVNDLTYAIRAFNRKFPALIDSTGRKAHALYADTTREDIKKSIDDAATNTLARWQTLPD